jgi:uncharacterized protein YndB with AHSA1/START domain
VPGACAGYALRVARTVATAGVPPAKVWAVLADPYAYPRWVVGADTIRYVEGNWPAPGAKIHHRVGRGPFKLNDNTEVIESAPPNRLVLQARTRPLGTVRVTMELVPLNGGTRVTMIEDPGDTYTRLLFNVVLDRVVAKRNVESLRRLVSLASGSPPAEEPAIESPSTSQDSAGSRA